MATHRPDPVPIAEPNLRAFFHQSLHDAASNQHLDVPDATLWYLTNLLTEFSDADQLFERTDQGRVLVPLAEWYARAARAETEARRKQCLRRLGDVALFVSGLFSGLFTRRRRLVDVDYYMAMGESAYGTLFEASSRSAIDASLGEIFEDLSSRFVVFADMLAEVGESAWGSNDSDLLRLHAVWARTDSPRLARKLREAGIVPERLGVVH